MDSKERGFGKFQADHKNHSTAGIRKVNFKRKQTLLFWHSTKGTFMQENQNKVKNLLKLFQIEKTPIHLFNILTVWATIKFNYSLVKIKPVDNKSAKAANRSTETKSVPRYLVSWLRFVTDCRNPSKGKSVGEKNDDSVKQMYLKCTRRYP